MSEATITRWLVGVGDVVEIEQGLLEVSTDKVDTEIPSPVSGVVVELLADENEEVAVGSAVCVVGRRAEAVAPGEVDEPSVPAAPPPAHDESAASAHISPPPATPAPPIEAASEPAPPAPAGREVRSGSVVKMSRLRTIIARRMVESLHVSAQLTTVVEVDVTRVVRLRERVKDEVQRREGVKISVLPFVARAAVLALRDHPVISCTIDDATGEVHYPGDNHLGVAVDSEKGLFVPVVRDVDDRSVVDLAKCIADVAARVRSGAIGPDELTGGTFTITNTGSRGALFDTPILNQPQVAILGVGATVRRPVVLVADDGGETIGVRSMAHPADDPCSLRAGILSPGG